MSDEIFSSDYGKDKLPTLVCKVVGHEFNNNCFCTRCNFFDKDTYDAKVIATYEQSKWQQQWAQQANSQSQAGYSSGYSYGLGIYQSFGQAFGGLLGS